MSHRDAHGTPHTVPKHRARVVLGAYSRIVAVYSTDAVPLHTMVWQLVVWQPTVTGPARPRWSREEEGGYSGALLESLKHRRCLIHECDSAGLGGNDRCNHVDPFGVDEHLTTDGGVARDGGLGSGEKRSPHC